MRALIGRLRSLGTPAAGGLAPEWLGMTSGFALLIICLAIDVVLTEASAAMVGTFVVAPFVTALLAGPRATAIVGASALALAAISPWWNMELGDHTLAVRLALLAAGVAIAVAGAWFRARQSGRSERMRLLDAVGAVADGSLPLAETLREVTRVIVPALADVCMVDAIHEGRVSRIATRARGREDAAQVEERIRARPPALPRWLVEAERSWKHIPQWYPRVRDEELRRMAQSAEDLEFLRGLGLRSILTVPIRARDRNLGTLTLLTAWSGRRFDAVDVRFTQILASRIGLALDNAGLFSDLESVERRMDTVMSILDEAIVIQGSGGELVYANPAAADMLGFESTEHAISTPAAVIGERFLVRDEHGEELPPSVLAGRGPEGRPASPQLLRVIDRSVGTERWLRAKAKPIEGPTGEVLYSVTAIEDVTDVKAAELTNRLLARIGELASQATEHSTALERVPGLIVPEFADWCSIEMPRADGLIERVAIAHRDTEMLGRARELRGRFPLHIDDDTPITRVLRGEPARVIDVDDAAIESVSVSPEHARALREAGFRSVIVAPMTAGGRTVGVLTFVNHLGGRRFAAADLDTATELARRAGLAIENARLAEERARVADALQRELLPPSLPRMPGWEVATMYEPAGEVNEVGGDFYEVFRVRDGWAVVLGDVSGKGAAAAALTAEARHTIRAAGALAQDPVAGLRLLDRNLRTRDDVSLCSVVLVVLPDAPASGAEVEIYLAGHPHPMLLREGRAIAVGEPGPLLGVLEAPTWPPVAETLEPGDQLVLYTDGVIEARGPDGERFGTERLRLGLAGCLVPERTVAGVRGALEAFGARARDDDAAVVAIRRSGPEPSPAFTREPGRPLAREPL